MLRNVLVLFGFVRLGGSFSACFKSAPDVGRFFFILNADDCRDDRRHGAVSFPALGAPARTGAMPARTRAPRGLNRRKGAPV